SPNSAVSVVLAAGVPVPASTDCSPEAEPSTDCSADSEADSDAGTDSASDGDSLGGMDSDSLGEADSSSLANSHVPCSPDSITRVQSVSAGRTYPVGAAVSVNVH